MSLNYIKYTKLNKPVAKNVPEVQMEFGRRKIISTSRNGTHIMAEARVAKLGLQWE